VAHRPLIAGNWKMHLTHLEAIQLVQQLSYRLEREDYDKTEVVVIPPATSLRSIQTVLEGDRLPIGLGAQHCHHEDAGAFTGEVSPPMLAALTVTYVVCGHSERRHVFGEDDAEVNMRVRAVARHGMRPILCVGETLDQRETGDAESVVSGQLSAGLDGLEITGPDELVIAYEPVWAIGTGRTASADDADAMCGHIRGELRSRLGPELAEDVRVQYGGSVKPGNVVELMGRDHIDGALVGGASLDADDFAAICRYHRM
jgi:triosephosphate isomerase